MKKIIFLLGILIGFPVLAEVNNGNNALSRSLSESQINQNFEAGKPSAQAPQFGINASGGSVPLFTEATRPADQLFEASEKAEEELGIDQNAYLTGEMVSEMELGIRQDRALAFVSFSPKPDFMRGKYLNGDDVVIPDEHDAFWVPKFTKTLDINGEYLGLVYVTSRPGVPATNQDLQNAVIAFTHENISVYFPGKKLYLVNVPNGAGINVGVSTESTSKGVFASIASLFGGGGASGALGASYTKNDGDTRYATTFGRQILVFIDGGIVPIHIDFTEPKK